MKNFDEKHIRNVVLLGATKSGKTTLAEAMLFEAGMMSKRGTVEEGNTLSDYQEMEKQRGHSIYSTCLHAEWRNYKINIIDTPGLEDFIGEVASSIRIGDTALMLLNAQYGIETSTELIWDFVEPFKKPTVLAINQLDSDKANFSQVVEEAGRFFGPGFTLMQYPLNPGLGFNAVIDLLKMTMYRFGPQGGKPEKLPIPDSQKQEAERLHQILVEKAAEHDDQLMELYFEKGNLDEEELRKGLKIGMMKHEVFPVFCLSAKRDMGSGRLMGFIDHVAPSAVEMRRERTLDGQEVIPDTQGPACLLVFKTLLEAHVGKISLFKVLSGVVRTGMELMNLQRSSTERINQLFVLDGAQRLSVNTLFTGDIGGALKLKNTFTQDTLVEKGFTGTLEPIIFPTPRVRTAILARNKTDDEKLGEVLQDIHSEDPSLEVEYNQELKQVILHGQGELHLAITRWKLEKRYQLQVDFQPAKISFRETIQRAAHAFYRHKKQSGGAGQFGEVYLKVEPLASLPPSVREFPIRGTETISLPWGGQLVFNNCIVGGAIDTRFLPAILKGIMEKMQEGPLTGSFVRDLQVSVYDGKMHPVDSNDISFKIAGMMAFREAFLQASPQLLEPVFQVDVRAPVTMMGEILSELQSHRSIISGMDNDQGFQVVHSRTPQAELDRLYASLRNITQGKAKIKAAFLEYAAVAFDLQRKLSEEYHKNSANG
ncbi:MAG: elongation factor G [Chitinophagaceae bacterium]